MKASLVHKTLDNGLNIYFYQDQTKHSFVIDFIVKYGASFSDFTSDGQTYHIPDGMAHLIEHLMFEKNKEGDFSQIFGKKNFRCNAATYPYITEYYANGVKNAEYALKKMILGLSKRTFTKRDIEAIKPPIYQEIKMRNDELNRKVSNTKRKNMFQNITYNNGLGTIENVKNFDHDTVALCFDTFYQPKNEALFIAGNINIEKMYNKIKEIYKTITFKNVDFEVININENKKILNDYEIIEMPVAKNYVDLSFKVDFSAFSLEEKRMLTYYLDLFLILNFSESSPFYKEVTAKKIIEGAMNTSYSFVSNYLIIGVGAYINDEDYFTKRVKDIFQKEHNWKQEFFDLQVKKMCINNICSDATPFMKSREFVSNMDCNYYADFDTLEEIKSLNLSDCKNLINKLAFQYYTITKVTNLKE